MITPFLIPRYIIDINSNTKLLKMFYQSHKSQFINYIDYLEQMLTKITFQQEANKLQNNNYILITLGVSFFVLILSSIESSSLFTLVMTTVVLIFNMLLFLFVHYNHRLYTSYLAFAKVCIEHQLEDNKKHGIT